MVLCVVWGIMGVMMLEMNSVEKRNYYKMLVAYGLICLAIVLPSVLLMMLDNFGIYTVSSNIKTIILALLPLIAIFGLFLAHPLFFEQIKNRSTKKIQYDVLGGCFLALGGACLFIAIVSQANNYIKYFICPTLAVILMGYGATFLLKRNE